jgi:hypothetical protein
MTPSTGARGARRLRLLRTRKGRGLAVLLAALAIGVPVAWASHDFADVPDGQQFHDQIGAIKDAGITTGCGGGNYCPDDFVRRDAMAAFMHRGYGRVAEGSFESVAIPLSYNVPGGAVGTVNITTGIPASAPDANGFIKADAVIEINRASAAGCPCTYDAALGLDFDPFITDGPSLRYTVNAAGQYTIPLTGAIPADTGTHIVEVLIQGPSGATASGYVTATYFPFGPTGTDAGITASEKGGGSRRP